MTRLEHFTELETTMNKRSMREYRIWKAMKSRCYSPSQTKGYYKQNNIQVCDRWLHSFDNFLADMGKCPFPDASIERIDNLGDYCPENCKWIHQREQQKNRSNVPIYVYGGEAHCLKEWSKELGINYDKLRGRLRNGWSFQEAIEEF